MPRHDKITGDGSVIETKRIFPSIHNRIITLEVGLHEVSCLAISEYDSFFRRILVTSTVFVTEYNFKQHVASDIGIDELYVLASSLKSQDNLFFVKSFISLILLHTIFFLLIVLYSPTSPFGSFPTTLLLAISHVLLDLAVLCVNGHGLLTNKNRRI